DDPVGSLCPRSFAYSLPEDCSNINGAEDLYFDSSRSRLVVFADSQEAIVKKFIPTGSSQICQVNGWDENLLTVMSFRSSVMAGDAPNALSHLSSLEPKMGTLSSDLRASICIAMDDNFRTIMRSNELARACETFLVQCIRCFSDIHAAKS